MRTRVRKWGNSLAVRIPRSIAEHAGLEENTPIQLLMADGRLVIEPLPKQQLTLEQLLETVTDGNLHREIERGPSVGNEVW